MTITGTIEHIENQSSRTHAKMIVTIVPNHLQKAFIEFRGQRIHLLKMVKVGDDVTVDYNVVGKISKSSGITYNNLVATAITDIKKPVV
jgi:hypothetical protein